MIWFDDIKGIGEAEMSAEKRIFLSWQNMAPTPKFLNLSKNDFITCNIETNEKHGYIARDIRLVPASESKTPKRKAPESEASV